MPAGYSGTPLAKKLGIKESHRVGLIDAPGEFALEDLPADVEIRRSARGRFDVAVLFSLSARKLEKRFAQVASKLETAGGLWVAWPKKTSGVATDLDFSVVQRVGLDSGLVDNKICAIDDTWSGLRFVIRLRDRPGR